MSAIENGILCGLLLAVVVGPMFFILLQTSIDKGFRSGVYLATGIALSDSSYIFIAYFGIAPFMHNEIFRKIMGIAGGFIILIYGVYSMFKALPNRTVVVEDSKNDTPTKYILRGFFINGINPFVLLFWLSVISTISVNYNFSANQMIVFFTTSIFTVFSTDILKSYLANKLRNILTDNLLKWMNRIVGIALILFSFKLFYFAFGNH